MRINQTPVVAVFDIGKTNKKFLLFSKNYEVVYETSHQFDEIKDDDGEVCEDLATLMQWIKSTFTKACANQEFKIEALNFSTYGASFVHLDKDGKPVTPLYNYLKNFPEELNQKFYNTYGDKNEIARRTASPVLGNLNSGLQIYQIKHQKPELFRKIKVSLHLPQFVSSLFTGHYFSDITSIGCHTQLWNFDNQIYDAWILNEGFDKILPPIAPSHSTITITIQGSTLDCGIGLHDSSAALIPYLKKFDEPFMLLSTGTWCISLNPFNNSALTIEELSQDCLCYLSYDGKPIKASRLFSGYEHEQEVKKLAAHFNKADDYYGTVRYNDGIPKQIYSSENLNDFKDYESAYHALVALLVNKQHKSSMLVLKNQPVKRIFVDGGFSKNEVFMHLLASVFPALEIYSATVPQASALGAAMVIDKNNEFKQLNISIKRYSYQV